MSYLLLILGTNLELEEVHVVCRRGVGLELALHKLYIG